MEETIIRQESLPIAGRIGQIWKSVGSHAKTGLDPQCSLENQGRVDVLRSKSSLWCMY